MIEAYNAGAASIEQLFAELVNLAQGLSDEQQRHVREQMTEEELVIFDILTRPAPDLSDAEIVEVKKVAREMLNRLRSLLVVDWRTKRSAVANVQLTIQDALDTGLPEKYDATLYKDKCSAVFEHVYDKYAQAGVSVYSQAS